MGLDSVEIVLEIEEAFGINIPNEIATNLLTVQDVVDYIAGRVPTIPQQACETQQIYYRLRRGFRAQIPALMDDLDLRTRLNDVLHKDQWPHIWSAVREQVGEDYWPEDIPWPRLLRPGPVTVRDLVYYIAFALPKPDVEQNEPWTRERIALQVRDIVKDYTGDVGFRRTARFVQDLNIG